MTRHPRPCRTLALAALLALAACQGGRRPAGEPPPRLQDTGLYADFATRELAPGVLPFAPQYPLWSDGARKRRWIALPPGAAIDACDPDHWRFPVGTRLWKEFGFDRPVETRYLEQVAEGVWMRATYLWNADGSDAPLAPEHGAPRAAEPRPGVFYDVPGRSSCTACHDPGSAPVLGFSALQLSPDRDPAALHAEAPEPGSVDLPELLRRGLLRGLPASLAAEPPRIAARSERERAVLGYLHGNCSSCHNPRGPLADLGLSLAYPLAPAEPCDPAPAIGTAVGQPSSFRPHPAPDPCLRVAPGAPADSVLVRRIGTRNPLLQMPPLGSRLVDAEAVALIEAWIRDDLAADAGRPVPQPPVPVARASGP